MFQIWRRCNSPLTEEAIHGQYRRLVEPCMKAVPKMSRRFPFMCGRADVRFAYHLPHKEKLSLIMEEGLRPGTI